MFMITPHEVIELTGVKPQNFRLEKTDTNRLEEILMNWIEQCEGLITDYCYNSFNDGVPYSVKNVCLRLMSNMVAFAQTRKDTPVIKVNDWTTSIVGSDIFTDDLKEDLKPYCKERPSSKSDPIDFFCICGD